MSNQVNVAYVQQYPVTLELLLQQMGSVLSKAVENRSYVGKAAKVVEQIGAVTATELLVRHADTEPTDTPHAARWCFPRNWGVADYIDDEDLVQMLIDPKNGYAQSQAMALGRTKDDLIIEAMYGNNMTGENGSTAVTFANDGGTSIAEGGVGMTVDKLREAKKALILAEVNVDYETLWCAIGGQQHDDLLSETQAISLDYTNKPVLVDGRIKAFMGFNFIDCQRLPLVGDDRYCFAWAQSGMVCGQWNGITASVDRVPTKWNNTLVQAKATWGATRTQGEKIVKIICDE
jgi:hypothetical protein